MSEREFENYLRLLGGLLKLSGRQRAQIAGELRDHMEERLADLRRQGLRRERAIAMALEEFGETAALAADLTRIGKQRTRRWIMRMTVGSITAAAAAIFVAMTLWPDPPGGMTPQLAVAQSADQLPKLPPAQADAGKRAAAKKPASAGEDQRNAATLATLAKSIDADFSETPFDEVMQQIAEMIDVQLFIDRASLDDEGIGADTPVTIALRDVPVDTLLDLMLDQLGLGYTVRSGILVVATQPKLEEVIEIRVYDVHDLLSAYRGASRVSRGGSRRGYGEGGEGGEGGDAMGESGRGGGARGGYGRSGGYGGYARGGGYGDEYAAQQFSALRRTPPSVDIDALYELQQLTERLSNDLAVGNNDRRAVVAEARQVAELSGRLLQMGGGKLLNIITTTVAPDSWETVGGVGSIREYQEALIVAQTQSVHREVQRLLDDLRKVAKANRGSTLGRAGIQRSTGRRRLAPPIGDEPAASGTPFGSRNRGTRPPRRAPRDPSAGDDMLNAFDPPSAGFGVQLPTNRDDPFAPTPVGDGGKDGDAEDRPKPDAVDDLFGPPSAEAEEQPDDDG